MDTALTHNACTSQQGMVHLDTVHTQHSATSATDAVRCVLQDAVTFATQAHQAVAARHHSVAMHISVRCTGAQTLEEHMHSPELHMTIWADVHQDAAAASKAARIQRTACEAVTAAQVEQGAVMHTQGDAIKQSAAVVPFPVAVLPCKCLDGEKWMVLHADAAAWNATAAHFQAALLPGGVLPLQVHCKGDTQAAQAFISGSSGTAPPASLQAAHLPAVLWELRSAACSSSVQAIAAGAVAGVLLGVQNVVHAVHSGSNVVREAVHLEHIWLCPGQPQRGGCTVYLHGWGAQACLMPETPVWDGLHRAHRADALPLSADCVHANQEAMVLLQDRMEGIVQCSAAPNGTSLLHNAHDGIPSSAPAASRDATLSNARAVAHVLLALQQWVLWDCLPEVQRCSKTQLPALPRAAHTVAASAVLRPEQFDDPAARSDGTRSAAVWHAGTCSVPGMSTSAMRVLCNAMLPAYTPDGVVASRFGIHAGVKAMECPSHPAPRVPPAARSSVEGYVGPRHGVALLCAPRVPILLPRDAGGPAQLPACPVGFTAVDVQCVDPGAASAHRAQYNAAVACLWASPTWQLNVSCVGSALRKPPTDPTSPWTLTRTGARLHGALVAVLLVAPDAHTPQRLFKMGCEGTPPATGVPVSAPAGWALDIACLQEDTVPTLWLSAVHGRNDSAHHVAAEHSARVAAALVRLGVATWECNPRAVQGGGGDQPARVVRVDPIACVHRCLPAARACAFLLRLAPADVASEVLGAAVQCVAALHTMQAQTSTDKQRCDTVLQWAGHHTEGAQYVESCEHASGSPWGVQHLHAAMEQFVRWKGCVSWAHWPPSAPQTPWRRLHASCPTEWTLHHSAAFAGVALGAAVALHRTATWSGAQQVPHLSPVHSAALLQSVRATAQAVVRSAAAQAVQPVCTATSEAERLTQVFNPLNALHLNTLQVQWGKGTQEGDVRTPSKGCKRLRDANTACVSTPVGATAGLEAAMPLQSPGTWTSPKALVTHGAQFAVGGWMPPCGVLQALQGTAMVPLRMVARTQQPPVQTTLHQLLCAVE